MKTRGTQRLIAHVSTHTDDNKIDLSHLHSIIIDMTLSQTRVDIVLPFHKLDKFLDKAIMSVNNSQSIKVRLILVNEIRNIDDVLLDRFIKSLSRYSNIHETIVIEGPLKGYAAALNSTRNFIKSDFVGILNSDDYLHNKKIITQIQCMQKQKSDLCIGRLVKKKRGIIYPSLGINLGKKDTYQPSLLLLGAYGANASVLVRKTAWLQYCNFDEESKSSDWSTALNSYSKLSISYEPKSKYFYRMHSGQITKSKNYQDHFLSIYPLWSKICLSYGLPPLDFISASLIAVPSNFTSYRDINFYGIADWVEQFKKLNGSSSAKKILTRRETLMVLKGYKNRINIDDLIRLICGFVLKKFLDLFVP